MKTHLAIMAASLCVAFLSAAHAADKQASTRPDTEALIAAREDEIEAKLPLDQRPKRQYKGRLALYADGPSADAPAVYGSLSTERDGAFLIKLARPDVLDEMKKYNQQVVSLEGRVRVQGKYLVVERIYVPAPGPKRLAHGKSGGG